MITASSISSTFFVRRRRFEAVADTACAAVERRRSGLAAVQSGRPPTTGRNGDDRLSIAARSGRKSRCIRTPDRYFVASDDRSSPRRQRRPPASTGVPPTGDARPLLPSVPRASRPTAPLRAQSPETKLITLWRSFGWWVISLSWHGTNAGRRARKVNGVGCSDTGSLLPQHWFNLDLMHTVHRMRLPWLLPDIVR